MYKNDLLTFKFMFYFSFFPFLLGYVWFPENLRENAKKRKYKEKVERKKK